MQLAQYRPISAQLAQYRPSVHTDRGISFVHHLLQLHPNRLQVLLTLDALCGLSSRSKGSLLQLHSQSVGVTARLPQLTSQSPMYGARICQSFLERFCLPSVSPVS